MRTMIVVGEFITILAIGLGQAHASKPKVPQRLAPSVNASSTEAAQAAVDSLPTRTSTGRPADLDPRIPWLEDLQMPQSGGPEPLVKAGEMRIPFRGLVDSLAVTGDLIVLMIRAHDQPGRLVALSRDGVPRWTRTLEGRMKRFITAGGGSVYVVPQAVDESAGDRPLVLAFSLDGRQAGQWSFPLPPDGTVARLEYARGILVADLLEGGRISTRVDQSSTTDPEDIVTAGDLNVGGIADDQKAFDREYAGGKLLVGVKRSKRNTAGEVLKRNARTRNWRGRKLAIGQMPFMGRAESPGKSRPGARIRILWFETIREDGSAVLESLLINVRGKPWVAYGTTKYPGTEDAFMISEHRRDGSLRSYLILPVKSTHFLAGDDVYVPEKGKLVRWEHVK